MDNVKKIQEHFWIIEDNGVRVFVFEGEKEAMVIDSGFGSLPIKDIVSELTRLPVFLVNTHADRDHVGCNKAFDRIYMHPAEMDRYKQSLPEGLFMENVRPLWEGDIIDLGLWRFEVILTPGHTPGSIMLLEGQKRMLISGDSIQDGSIYMFGPGRNIYAFQNSLEKMGDMAKAFDTIWPSHGSCPIKGDIIPALLQGVKDLRAGKLTLEEPPHPMPCKKYSCGAAAFLYSE